jgi:tagatose 1,6-diphosphate aldolase
MKAPSYNIDVRLSKRRYIMRKISPEVAKHMDNLSNEAGVISALAIDQRGSLKRMLAEAANKPADETTIVDFKKLFLKN